MNRRTFALTLTALIPIAASIHTAKPSKADTSDDTVYLIDAASKLTDMVFGFDDLRTAADALIDLRVARGIQDGDTVALMAPVDRITKAARAAIELVPTEKYLLAFTFLQKAAFYAMTATNLFVMQMQLDTTALSDAIKDDMIRFRAAKDEYIDIVKRLNQDSTSTPRPTIRPTRKPIRTATPALTAAPAIAPTAKSNGAPPTARPVDPTKAPAQPPQSQPANPTSPPVSGPTAAPEQPTSPPPPPAPPTEAAPPPKFEATVAPSP